MTRLKSVIAVSSAVALTAGMMITGCKKTTDNTINYKSALNTYYAANPSCMWSQPQKFPVQTGTSDASTAPYDALVDQGLLTRSTTEKKIIIISKQMTNYDLSDKGRSAWTADTTQPGYGNFCYGTRSVSSIDSSSPTTSEPGATTTVSYHYGISNAPTWASAAETQNAFPRIAGNLAGGTATATLVDTSNGWQVQTPPPSAGSTSMMAPSSADGKVVGDK
jgi:hypothetical protein